MKISREQAIDVLHYQLAHPGAYNYTLMCKEIGQDDDFEEVAIDEDTLDDIQCDTSYQTFEVWWHNDDDPGNNLFRPRQTFNS